MPAAPPSEAIGYADQIPIPSSFDRLEEAHFWIHGLEQSYHYGSRFRWNLNAFLRALKEIPRLLKMEMQNESGFQEWFRPHKKNLRDDPLIDFLSKQRDVAVHRKMIVPDSKCWVGVTELRGLKLGVGMEMDAREDSDHAMHQYFCHILAHGDDFGILMPDDDSIPCVYREWRLSGFDDEVIDLAEKAWLLTGTTIAEVLKWKGLTPPPPSLSLYLVAMEARRLNSNFLTGNSSGKDLTRHERATKWRRRSGDGGNARHFRRVSRHSAKCAGRTIR